MTNVSDSEAIQIIVPLAGKSPFFPPEHFFFPKSLIEVSGRPMIEWVVENLKGLNDKARFLFVVHQEEVSRFSLDRTLRFLANGRCEIVALRQQTRGALCSCLLTIDQLEMDLPLVVANGDQYIDGDLPEALTSFRRQGAHAGVITFDSVHPRWSYVALDPSGRVVQAAEKNVISRNAIAGFYYFKSARVFVDAAMRCIENKIHVDGQFFIAPCLNEIILSGGAVASYRISDADYHSFYSPDRIRNFEKRGGSRKPPPKDSATDIRVVIPAAGLGTRFAREGYARPKPFIEVCGRPMIAHVIENVAPPGAQVHLLLRKEHVVAEAHLLQTISARRYRIHEVERLTEGTACTLLLARKHFDDGMPLLVANSDQIVDFSVDDFVRDCITRGLDGSIVVFRDRSRNPKWSFARVDESRRVTEVAEKRPISDFATVGIYLFRRGSDFVAGAIDMIARNDRVNDEFYTCPVFNYLIASGRSIGAYEVPAGAMHGLGTPEDLEAYVRARSTAGR